MAIFSTFAANASQPLSETYRPAAEQINIGKTQKTSTGNDAHALTPPVLGCGPTFVNATVHVSQSPHSLQAPLPLTYLILTAFLFLNYLFQ
jgi:hypothetical protein